MVLVSKFLGGGGGGGGGGVLVKKLFCSFFNPVISLYIYYDQYEKIWGKKSKKKIPEVGFHGNGSHIRFYGTHQGTYNFKTASSSSVKSCTHIEHI